MVILLLIAPVHPMDNGSAAVPPAQEHAPIPAMSPQHPPPHPPRLQALLQARMAGFSVLSMELVKLPALNTAANANLLTKTPSIPLKPCNMWQTCSRLIVVPSITMVVLTHMIL